MKRDPLKFAGVGLRFPGMKFVDHNSTKQPYIGVTQGGSSRPGHPAKRAATKGEAKAEEIERG